jgi:hypothetical protein
MAVVLECVIGFGIHGRHMVFYAFSKFRAAHCDWYKDRVFLSRPMVLVTCITAVG